MKVKEINLLARFDLENPNLLGVTVLQIEIKSQTRMAQLKIKNNEIKIVVLESWGVFLEMSCQK